MKSFSYTFLFVFISNLSFAQTFTEDGASAGINLGGSKEGGAVWADFDNDGDLDLAINTSSGFGVTYLYQNNGDGTFTDRTSTYILEIGNGTQCCERSIIWGDLNNDGFIDLIGNTYYRIEIYLNRGTDSSPNFKFGVGDASMSPNMTILRAAVIDDMNAEGIGVLDYNNDGWLDLVIENDQHGIDIFRNDKNGTRGVASSFLTQVTIDATGNLGLPSGAHSSGNQGDYIATGDYNNDGFMDILARKHISMRDVWTNNQDGTFSANTSFLEGASGDKGGVIFCDFDSDGDFDIYWTDSGINQIWLQTGLNSGNFVASNTRIDGIGQPDLSGISGTINIDGCACGDVDNDGDVDLFLGNDGRSGSGRATGSFLFINNTSSTNDIEALSFSYTNINALVNAEGVNLVDYDNDGDVDIYINADGSNNQLWKNDNCDGGGCDFFKVVSQDCIDGSNVTRPVVGATLVLKDDMGNIVNAAQDMNSAMGHGAQNPALVNFSVPDPSATYTLEITFPAKIIAPDVTPTVETYSYDFVPNTLVNDTLIITSLYASDGNTCDFSVLPIELLYFKGTIQDKIVILKWATGSEINNDFFTIERSLNGYDFESIGTKPGSGNTTSIIFYEFYDERPISGITYYRLKQTDFDGRFDYSKIIAIKYDPFGNSSSNDLEVMIYPNPAKGNVIYVNVNTQIRYDDVEISIFDLAGKLYYLETLEMPNNQFDIPIERNLLKRGLYILQLKDRSGIRTAQFIIN